MAHPQQINFCESIRKTHQEHFVGKRVLDCGSLDINGNNRYLFTGCEYIGIDVGTGPNVDMVTPIHKFYDNYGFDTIISTECFEHDMYYLQSLENIIRLLHPGGMFLFTCASTGRPEHGTERTSPANSPLTAALDGWENYYKNLTITDIINSIDVDDIFHRYGFEFNGETCDLYFWGIKK